jgi:hypothetical protein
MKKMPTSVAEKVYDVLMRFAEASPNHYERESFIFHFGVLEDKSNQYTLTCMDDKPRVFTCKKDGAMWITGKGDTKVNPILYRIGEEAKKTKALFDAAESTTC